MPIRTAYAFLRKNWHLLVLIPALWVKFGDWRGSHPVLEGHSTTYSAPAEELLHGSYSGVETFRRTPGYPAFLAPIFFFWGESAAAVTFFQHLLGLGTVLAAMLIALLLWESRPAAAAAGAILAFNPNLGFFEGQVESETLHFPAVPLFAVPGEDPARAGKDALGAGGRSVRKRGGHVQARDGRARAGAAAVPGLDRQTAPRRCCFSLSFMSPLLLWMARNWLMFGLFTLSPMGAITSLQTSGPFVDWSSPRFGELKRIYADVQLEKGGGHQNVINEALYLRGLEIKFDKALIEGHQLGVETFLSHPVKYLLATRANFVDFLRSAGSGRDENTGPLQRFLLDNFLALAAAGLAAALFFAPGREIMALALSFFCLAAGNCLVEIGIPRRSIEVVPLLAIFVSYLFALPAILAAKVRAARKGVRVP